MGATENLDVTNQTMFLFGCCLWRRVLYVSFTMCQANVLIVVIFAIISFG